MCEKFLTLSIAERTRKREDGVCICHKTLPPGFAQAAHATKMLLGSAKSLPLWCYPAAQHVLREIAAMSNHAASAISPAPLGKYYSATVPSISPWAGRTGWTMPLPHTLEAARCSPNGAGRPGGLKPGYRWGLIEDILDFFILEGNHIAALTPKPR